MFSLDGLLNASLYTVAGLGVFAVCVRVVGSDSPTEPVPTAIIKAAAIIGAALIIAHTMH